LELTPEGVKETIGDYDRYLERKSQDGAAQSSAASHKKSGKNDYQERKEKASLLRKSKTRLKKCEEEIETVENEIAEIEEGLASSDYETLLTLTKSLEEKTALRDALYAEWESLSDYLTANEN